MKNKLFSNFVYQYPITNWNEKKSKIVSLINNSTLERHNNQWFESDRNTNNNCYVDQFVEIISSDLQKFVQDVQCQTININTAWTVKYQKGDFHPPHTHSATGYSGVLYLEYDDTDHTPVYFVDSVTDPITDKTNYCVPDVHEGMIVIAPSNVLHFTYPNTSEKVRQIVGFDIKF